jgi:hypothetical protein
MNRQATLFPEMLEGTAGLEPATTCLEGRCSDPSELRPRTADDSADDSSEASKPAFSSWAAEHLKSVVEFAAFAEMPAREFLQIVKTRYLVECLKLEDGHQGRAAGRAGVHRNVLLGWARELKLDMLAYKPKKKKQPCRAIATRRKARRA